MSRAVSVLRIVGTVGLAAGAGLGITLAAAWYRRPINAQLPTNFQDYEVFSVILSMISLMLIVGSLYRRNDYAKSAQPYSKQEERGVEIPADYQLSQLDIVILRSLKAGNSEKDVARNTGVDLDVIREKLDLLYELDYITQKSELTEKGYETVNQRPDSAGAPTNSSTTVTRQPRVPPRTGEREKRYGQLALGIIFVLVGLPTLLYYSIASSTPFVGGYVAGSYAGTALFGLIILVAGVALVVHSQA